MIRRRIFLVSIAFMLSMGTMAQVRKYSNEFLNIGVDAHAFGMSNSIIASVNDVSAGYWNPAGLSAVRNEWQLGLMHAEYFASLASYDYLAGAKPIDAKSTIGVSVIRFGVDDIMDTSELIDKDGNIDYNRITLFSAADYAFLFSYAKVSKIEGLSYGGNVKLIYRGIGDFADAYGFGFDLGAQFHKEKWSYAAVLRDATSTFNAWVFDAEKYEDVFAQTGNEMPENGLEITLPKLILGVARKFELGEKFSLLSEIDMVNHFDGERNSLISGNVVSIDPSAGFEFGYINMVFLRLGVGNFQYATELDRRYLTLQPNLGVGLKYKNIQVDYALTDIGDQSVALYSNIFSLKLGFAKP